MVTQIQFKSAPSGPRMSRLLHPAACDSSVVYCFGTGAIPRLYTSHLTILGRMPPPFQVGLSGEALGANLVGGACQMVLWTF